MLIQHDKLRDLVTKMMIAAKSDEAEARAVADNLVDANLMGHDSHGVGLAPRYMKNARAGEMTVGGRASVITENGPYLLVDGNMGYGQIVGPETMELGIARARDHGCAIVGLRNVHHLGRIGAWAEMCVEAGFISIHYVNATGHIPYVAPFGGYEARYSTNPYCTGIPASDKYPRIILDMATSRVAQGKVRVAHYKGVEMMDEALVGADGKPTNDPSVIFNDPTGAMLSFGQHKGFGLAMLCEILAGGLTGGGASRPDKLDEDTIRNNMLTIIMDPNGFDTGAGFPSEIDRLQDWVRSSKAAEGHDKVRFAGDPERETMEKRKVDGIEIDDNTWAEMRDRSVEFGMDPAAFGN